MDVLGRFFALHVDPGLLIYGSYDPWLVALSVGIAIFASTMGLNAVSQAREIQSPHLRRVTLLAASLSLGCGVWAMHFIGMLAFGLCTRVRYDVGITTLSLLPSVAASWVALHQLSRDNTSKRQLAVSGLLVGAGIGTMHYTGMAAMNMAARLRYDPWMFALSIVVAVALALLALWIRFGMVTLIGRRPRVVLNAIAGSVMGLAISGMHYTGMAAARFIGQAESRAVLHLNDPMPLALSIALVTVVATVLVAAAGGLAQYRQLVDSLQSKEGKLQAILDTALDGILVFDQQGIIIKLNPAILRIYGWAAHELIGQPITRLLGESRRRQAEADMGAYIQQLEERLFQEVLIEGTRRDGSAVPIRLVLGKVTLEDRVLYVAYVSDISERVRMEAALRLSEAQFRTLIANIPGIAYRCKLDIGWPMVFVSDAVERVTGFAASDFIGDHPRLRFTQLVPQEDITQIAEVVEAAVAQGQSFVIEFRLKHRDGSWRWMWGNGSIVKDDDGQIQWIDGVLLDLTERRQMEEDLRVAKEKAEAAAVARSAFLANMSHEIRTPMNAIIGFTDVVLGGKLMEAQRKHLETVRRSAHALLHLLNDILDSSKLERGALELEELDFSLHDVLTQLCAEQSIHAARKGLDLRLDIDDAVGRFVKGDPHRLRQVLVNLVGNAVKFTERGAVTLCVRRLGTDLHFAVQDTGIGIAADRIDSIFEPFTQADASMSRRFGGTGLGTTISKQLIELMRGRIWVESVLGQGSTFHVQIPMPLGEEALAMATQAQDLGVLPPLRILAVDDVAQNTELLTLQLGRLGHDIVVASDGDQAVSLYAQGRFDVVLMDVQMPVMDGWQASREIRAMEAARALGRTPIIALSASVLPEDRHAALASGMDGFAVKPLDLPQLIGEMARLTGHEVRVDVAPDAELVQDLLPLDPELVDQQRALRRWGDIEAYRGALLRFVRDHEGWLAQPDWLQLPTPPSLAAQEAHRIKGIASNLGLSLLASACEQLEQGTRAGGTSSDLSALWRELRAAMDVTVQDLRRAGAERTAVAAVHDEAVMPVDEAQALIEVIRKAFHRGEPLEVELRRLLTGVQARVGPSACERVLQAVEDFEFEQADQALQQLAAQLVVEERSDVAV